MPMLVKLVPLPLLAWDLNTEFFTKLTKVYILSFMLLKAKPKTEAIQLKTMTLVNHTSPFCSKSHGSAAEKQFRDFHIMFVTTMVPSIETPVTKASALSQFRILNVSC